MDNEKEITEILHNADDKTIENITEEFPGYDKKDADRIYREVEKRMTLRNSGESADSVSGVERYKKNIVRRIATIAACIAFVAAGTGTVYMLSKSGPSKASSSIAAVTENPSDNGNGYSKSDIPEEITQEWLYERNKNCLSNFTRCSIFLKSSNGIEYYGIDQENGIKLSTVSTGSEDPHDQMDIKHLSYTYQNKCVEYIVPSGAEGGVLIESEPKDFPIFNYGDLLADLSSWSIVGREKFIDRDCAVIQVTQPGESPFFSGTDVLNFEVYIDLETGLFLKASVFNNESPATDTSAEYTLEATSIYVDDDVTEILTPHDAKEYFTLFNSENIDLSFLDVPLKHPFESSSAKEEPAIPDDITKDWLSDRCKNNLKNFDKCYMEYSESGQHWIKAVDNKNGIIYRKSVESDIIDYAYNGKRISIWPKHGDEPSVIENPAENFKPFDYGDYLDDFSLWDIMSSTEYNDRKCATIRYDPRPTGAAGESKAPIGQYIDLETGIIVASFTIENGSPIPVMETTMFHVNDSAAEIPTPQDIKKLIADGGYIVEEGLDLSFLDGAPNVTAETPAEKATDAQTAAATEAGTENATKAETTQSASDLPAEIDKDYIIDLVSNNMNSIDRVYAKVNERAESHDISGNIKPTINNDITIQYDKNKNCFCEYVNDIKGTDCYKVDYIVYKDTHVYADKSEKNYRVSNYAPADPALDAGDYLNGCMSHPCLPEILTTKDDWSITGIETVNGKECAVIEGIGDYNKYGLASKYVVYIDIKTGIAIKNNHTLYYDHSYEMIMNESSSEITELKLNDDAPILKPSDFKKYIVDSGFEPEDEESKDLSFLDE